jgi:ribosome-binding protein aMBF1 (putative translation factor)
MPKKSKPASDAVEVLHRRYYQGKPDRIAQLKEARAEDQLARAILQIREEAGLTQARLAKMIGTTESVISRLEDSSYQGHSVRMLRRIAEALGKRVEIRFLPDKPKLQAA